MSEQSLSAEERFADLVDELRGEPTVTPPELSAAGRRRFGANALKTHGKIFAMLTGGRLTLKLPAARVEALLASGAGARFDPRHDGRQLREWGVLAPDYTGDWLPLAQEARAFVAGEEG